MPIQPTVQSLLTESKQAHAAYREAAKTQNLPVCEQHVRIALARRIEAQTLDPTYTDPQWATDEGKYPHVKLMLFYQKYLRTP